MVELRGRALNESFSFKLTEYLVSIQTIQRNMSEKVHIQEGNSP